MARTRHAKEFIEFCTSRGLDLTEPRDITQELFKGYASYLATATCERAANSIGSIHNKMAAVRKLLKKRGLDLEKLGVDRNIGLGVGARSRNGTKEPVTDAVFESAVSMAVAKGENGFAHCIKLERYLGLRGLEAIMSPGALLNFAKEAESSVLRIPAIVTLLIVDGTKGGRPRETAVVGKFAAKTLEVIHDALEFAAANGGYLLIGKKPGLKASRTRYHKIAAMVGLVGKYAPHSLRYRYTCDKLEELRNEGVSRQEAMVLASKWLGHGPGRGRWVSMVYGKTVMHTFPKATRRQSQKSALAKIKALIAQFPQTGPVH